jgi:hypothetical protein
MKILPVGAELFLEDRHDEAASRFSSFCKRPYKCLVEETSNAMHVNSRTVMRSPANCHPCIPFTKYVSEYYSTIFFLYPTIFPLQYFSAKFLHSFLICNETSLHAHVLITFISLLQINTLGVHVMKFIVVRPFHFSVIHAFSVCLVRLNKHKYFTLSAWK